MLKYLVFVLAIAISSLSYIPFADAAEAPKQEMRETVSLEPPAEIKKIIDSLEIAGVVDQQLFSSKGDKEFDYALQYMVSFEQYSKSTEELVADVISVFAVTPVKNELGNVEGYKGEFVGVVIYGQNMSWFKDQKTKEAFFKALAEKKATK